MGTQSARALKLKITSGLPQSMKAIPVEIEGLPVASVTDNQNIKRYVALLTQVDTNAPVATVLENTLGEVPVWSYNDEGEYLAGTSNPVFTENKTTVLIGSPMAGNGNATQAVWLSTTGLYISTYSGGVVANGFLNDTVIEVNVYP